MSINAKLTAGCLVFACLVALLGWFGYGGDMRTRAILVRGYLPLQEALTSLNDAHRRAGDLVARLRLADLGGPATSRDPNEGRDEIRAGLSEILADLRSIEGLAPSGEASAALGALKTQFETLGAANGDVSRRLVLRELALSDDTFDRAFPAIQAEMSLVGDELLQRSNVDLWREVVVLAFCVSGAIVLCAWLSRTLVRRVRQARDIVAAMAEGRLDVPIPQDRTREFAAFYATLRALKLSMASNSALQARRLIVQANTFDHTIEAHQHRFAAALNNMSQGLCMLDANLKVVVFNEPFAKIFPHFQLGTTSEVVVSDPRFNQFLVPHETGTFLHDMPDGSMLQVKRRGVHGGGLVITFENITEQYRTSQRLEHLAGHDGLTDLPNRRLFRERLQAALREPRLRDLAVFCLDLNGFKAVNDTFGHPVGDALLIEVSRRLAACAGEDGVVARLGGDEFAILLPAAPQPEMAERLAERIVATLHRPFDIEERRIEIGVSIGITLAGDGAGGRESVTPDQLMQNCDLALYEAKAEERSTYRLYRPVLRERLRIRREMEADLRAAIERGEFELFYQPFVDTDRGAVSGFEALLRWRHPDKGMISPGLFVPVAEELGLIAEIGHWALDEACAQAALWPAGLTVSVNLSPVQFRDRRLVEQVGDALSRSGLAPERLQLEVTESLFLDKTDDILWILTALRGLGARISMDDFGTGYSSLGYLSRFPFDKIKIDQSFVRDIAKPESMAVIRAVIGLSRSMNMAVIAEGIETLEQYELLKAEGCREMQGYLFSKPRPTGDLPKLLVEISERWSRTAGAKRLPARLSGAA